MKVEPTVYITQVVPGRDYSSATRYGLPHILLSKEETLRSPDEVTSILTRQLKDIKPYDYLVLTGDIIACGIATHIALSNTRGFIKMLKWNREWLDYTEQVIKVII